MKKLYFTYDESSTGGEALSDEEWCSYADTYISVKFHEFYREQPSHRFFYDSIEVSDEVYELDRAYLAVIRYTDGGTFGSTSGYWYKVGVGASRKEAEEMIDAALSDKSEYKAWEGYFSSFDDREVHGMVIEGERK